MHGELFQLYFVQVFLPPRCSKAKAPQPANLFSQTMNQTQRDSCEADCGGLLSSAGKKAMALTEQTGDE